MEENTLLCLNMADASYVLSVDHPSRVARRLGLPLLQRGGFDYLPIPVLEELISDYPEIVQARIRLKLAEATPVKLRGSLEEIAQSEQSSGTFTQSSRYSTQSTSLESATSSAEKPSSLKPYYETLSWDTRLNTGEIFKVYKRYLNNPNRMSKGMKVYRIFNIVLEKGPSTLEDILANVLDTDFKRRTYEDKVTQFKKFMRSVSAPPLNFFVMKKEEGRYLYSINEKYLKAG